MRYLVDYSSDEVIGRIEGLPPIPVGCIVRYKGVNYRVIDKSSGRREEELYVTDRPGQVSAYATPDWILE